MLGETWKLQTNLLPAHYVCAWHSLSSLALSPAEFSKVMTTCSYRGSFGSLGNLPFPLLLWNSDVSLSTTLLHIPPHTENLSSLFSFCLIPPLGVSPNQLSQVFSGTVFASHPQKCSLRLHIQCQTGQHKEVVLLLLHSQIILSERPAKYNKGW